MAQARRSGALRLLRGGDQAAVEAYEPLPFDLRVHPMRPGLAHEKLSLTLQEPVADAVAHAARAEALPPGLWAGIAIESERVLRVSAEGQGVGVADLQGQLDRLSTQVGWPLPGAHGRRLLAYARAIRRGVPALPQPRAEECLAVTVAYHTMLAWDRQAAGEQKDTGSWAQAILAAVPAGRISWEAAAAQSGQTLAEWVALHAARRASSASA